MVTVPITTTDKALHHGTKHLLLQIADEDIDKQHSIGAAYRNGGPFKRAC